MDAHNITAGLFGVSEQSLEARRRYPGRVYLSLEIDPNDITKAVRRIRSAHEEHGIVAGLFQMTMNVRPSPRVLAERSGTTRLVPSPTAG